MSARHGFGRGHIITAAIRSLVRPGDVPIDLLLLEVMPAPGPSPGTSARGGEVVIPIDADGFEEALAAVRAHVQVIGSAA